MTVHEMVLYGPLAGAVELRQDIVRRAGYTCGMAVKWRRMVVVFAGLAALAFVVSGLASPQASSWTLGHSWISFTIVGSAWLLTSANVWLALQRLENAKSNLDGFVKHLPVYETNPPSLWRQSA